MAETLLPLHGKQECPIRFECSREELVGLVDRCNRLVLKEGVHSALCRTAIDILLNGAFKTPCKSERNPGVDPASVSRVRDAVLGSLRLESIRKWVVKESEIFTCEIVALRLARPVNYKIDPTNAKS
eukprot:5390379-Prymnesium_polylepis.2